MKTSAVPSEHVLDVCEMVPDPVTDPPREYAMTLLAFAGYHARFEMLDLLIKEGARKSTITQCGHHSNTDIDNTHIKCDSSSVCTCTCMYMYIRVWHVSQKRSIPISILFHFTMIEKPTYCFILLSRFAPLRSIRPHPFSLFPVSCNLTMCEMQASYTQDCRSYFPVFAAHT